IPYITTLAVSGRVQGADGGKIGGNSDRTSGGESQTDGRHILLDREDGGRMAAATTEPGMLSHWKNI
ncbi:hypothetical protein, partial [Clostridium sp. CAG:43]|uniref:hypothetical protein n=1 Tax=Clostridium sp. CAG:43 TaxID=1262805 RepID=UPI0025877975